MTDASLLRKYLHIAFIVAAYWVVSISLVFVNKALLSGKDVNIDAPLFITWFQCVVTLALCFLLSVLSRPFPSIAFPQLGLNLDIAKQMLPLSLIFVGMISFNNLCLKYVGVAFYFVGRSLTTIFNVVLSYAIIGDKTSFRAVICCFVIIIGFGLGVDQEGVAGSLSITGTCFGVLASLFVSLYSIYTKKALPVVDGNVVLLTYYNNINAVVLFIPLMILTGEVPVVWNYEKISYFSFWSLMALSGFIGFAIGFVTGWQIKATSPLTHNISGTAKACAQTVIATSYYNEYKPWLWWVSNWVVLFGSAAYARVRQLEMESAQMNKINIAGSGGSQSV